MDGFYKVSFATPLGNGSGVVQLKDGQLRGGDSAIYYTGTYTVSGTAMSANFSTGRHTPGMASVLGTDNAQVALQGQIKDGKITGVGTSPSAPGVQLRVVLEPIGH